MKHAVVIGGAGFVGSHLVENLLADGWSVHVFDDLSTGQLAFLPSHERLRFVEGDICRKTDLERLREGGAPDVLYHLAAVHHIPTCERDPAGALATNVVGFQHVLDYAVAVGVGRIVFASSGAVYDERHEGALSEDAPLHGNGIYGTSKLVGEALLRRVCEAAELEGVIARLFNVVGPRETNPHLLPDVMTQVRSGAKALKLGNLFPRRDYVHVSDVADALEILGHCSLRTRTEAFNVGSGVEYSVSDVVDELCRTAQVRLSVASDPLRQRQNDRMSQLADITKLASRTGWAPQRTLRDALSQMWGETRRAA